MDVLNSNNYLYLNNEKNNDHYLNKLSQSNQQNVDKVVKEFESVLIGILIKPIIEEVKDPFIEGGAGEIYQSLLIDEYSKVIAENIDLGIKDHIKDSLILQEVQNHEE